MILKADWMVAADALILIFLSEHRWRFAASPTVVSINTGVSQSHANRRLKRLEAAGLVDMYDDRGYYRITNLGERTVLGNATTEELEEVDPREGIED